MLLFVIAGVLLWKMWYDIRPRITCSRAASVSGQVLCSLFLLAVTSSSSGFRLAHFCPHKRSAQFLSSNGSDYLLGGAIAKLITSSRPASVVSDFSIWSSSACHRLCSTALLEYLVKSGHNTFNSAIVYSSSLLRPSLLCWPSIAVAVKHSHR
ncbi:MAG: hypothetical protein IPP40_10915 [bacterium]|nr:hypothetical protein [bacterium]